MLQSTSMSMPYQFATSQLAPSRKPTIGAPDVMLTTQPNTSLKRRSHIRRTSRSGHSPTGSTFSAAPAPNPQPQPKLEPLITAFARNISTSTGSFTPLVSRRPTLVDPMPVQWRDAPSYQPNVSSKADLSRGSTIASVYSAPSAEGDGYSSRRQTEENYVVDWTGILASSKHRTCLPPTPSSSSEDPAYSSPSAYSPIPTSLSRRNTHTNGLSRSNTGFVQSLLFERRSKYQVLPESPE
ncbi:hypothetical protein RhiLY_04521 [Ceratobasidium sp. AG-Ba]|nr:hypothetical protein RhiLY_04521 [Ceratobasidium sp. AG-Ba]